MMRFSDEHQNDHHHQRVDFEREIEWLRAKRDEVWQRVALLERVAGDDDHCDYWDQCGDDHCDHWDQCGDHAEMD